MLTMRSSTDQYLIKTFTNTCATMQSSQSDVADPSRTTAATMDQYIPSTANPSIENFTTAMLQTSDPIASASPVQTSSRQARHLTQGEPLPHKPQLIVHSCSPTLKMPLPLLRRLAVPLKRVFEPLPVSPDCQPSSGSRYDSMSATIRGISLYGRLTWTRLDLGSRKGDGFSDIQQPALLHRPCQFAGSLGRLASIIIS